MIDYFTIIAAKSGDERAIEKILNHYLPKIKKFSNNEDFVEDALSSVFEGIVNFKNKKI